MKLRKECPHGKYDAHPLTDEQRIFSKGWGDGTCPGGVFLPDDTLIIEKVDGEWPEWAILRIFGMIRRDLFPPSYVLDALSAREAE